MYKSMYVPSTVEEEKAYEIKNDHFSSADILKISYSDEFINVKKIDYKLGSDIYDIDYEKKYEKVYARKII